MVITAAVQQRPRYACKLIGQGTRDDVWMAPYEHLPKPIPSHPFVDEDVSLQSMRIESAGNVCFCRLAY
ncbi:protein of unknown function (plasmid) [Cupriavidus taiwanensis]|nr:protein of unknown function [Cupriavidus taiwanensis]